MLTFPVGNNKYPKEFIYKMYDFSHMWKFCADLDILSLFGGWLRLSQSVWSSVAPVALIFISDVGGGQ